jgi:voltage-gated potassium channel
MSFYKELFIALSLFLLVFLIGVFGFYWVAPKANWLDALYMTVITISTVGFGEVVQLDARGKLFTVGFIIVSISVIAYSAKILLSYFIEGTLTQQFQRQRMMKTIAKMNNHAIICGCGRTGKEALSQLMDMNFPVVIIEKDPAIFVQLPKKAVKILAMPNKKQNCKMQGLAAPAI